MQFVGSHLGLRLVLVDHVRGLIVVLNLVGKRDRAAMGPANVLTVAERRLSAQH